eukprot:scaffold161439_cov25-Tisochrysis_lutea.AAC.1
MRHLHSPSSAMISFMYSAPSTALRQAAHHAMQQSSQSSVVTSFVSVLSAALRSRPQHPRHRASVPSSS